MYTQADTTFRVIFILILAAAFLGIVLTAIILQIKLSKKENKWLGLVLPIISFLNAAAIAASVLFFMASVAITSVYVNGGEFTLETVIAQPGDVIGTAAAIFGMFNIPTIILLIIYFATRSKINDKSKLEKMSVMDLE